ncbi:hypothetical protein GLW08_08385 [Pontibacillus yanchengensis]|uniref:Uncharacterized protein n=1 Tax=Pontibacillus yanchengensis TaxID=462910 RepID=A0ACC7VGV5_9BACI|nr:pilus assembly protein PilM [Pontibacillus yanchengensis]MYL53354.1 hypothetical protein [Pontibacillus yanchengensis]
MRFSLKPLKPKKHRVNMVIKDHVIRFCYNDQASLEDIQFVGEQMLPSGIIKEGKVQDIFVLTSIIEELVETYNWKRKKLYFCVPDSSVVIRPYKIPADLQHDEVKGYLYMKLGEDLHLPFEDPVFDYHYLYQEEEHQHILLFAYPEEQIRTYESIFQEAKLKPQAADLSSLSLFRLYQYFEQVQEDEHLLSIQWNVDGCVVTVFHDERPVFIQHMKTPLDASLFKSNEEAFTAVEWHGEQQDIDAYIHDQVQEIERIMNFYRFSVTKGKAGITKVLLSGDFPQMDMIRQQCEERFSVPVEHLNISDIYTKEGVEIPDLLAETAGLSLKE